jgi:hypothetical protein
MQAAVNDRSFAAACAVTVRTIRNWKADKSLPSAAALNGIIAVLDPTIRQRRQRGEIPDNAVTRVYGDGSIVHLPDPSIAWGDLWGPWFERAHATIASDDRPAFDRIAFTWDGLVEQLTAGANPPRFTLLLPMRTEAAFSSDRAFQMVRFKRRQKLGVERHAVVRLGAAYRVAAQMHYAPSLGRSKMGSRELYLLSIGKERIVPSDEHEYPDVSARVADLKILYVEDLGES